LFLEKEIEHWEKKKNQALLKETNTSSNITINRSVFGIKSSYSSTKSQIVDTTWEQNRCQIQIDSMQKEMREMSEKVNMGTTDKMKLQGNVTANLVNYERQRAQIQANYNSQLKLTQDRRQEVRRLTYAVGGLSKHNQEKLAQTLRFLACGVSQFSMNLNFIKGYSDKFSNMLKQSCSNSPGMIQTLDFAKVVAKSASIGDVLQTNSVHFLISEDTRKISQAQLVFLNTKIAVSPEVHNAPVEVQEIMETTKKEYAVVDADVPLW